MTSRRRFIKVASLVGGLSSIPIAKGFSADDLTRQIDFSTAPDDDALFAMVRKQLLVPEKRIYLNTGSLGPSPLQVIEAQSSLIRQLEMNPVGENWGLLGNQMEGVRKKVADFVNADVEEILLTRNTTEGLNQVAQSLDLKSGDEILTTNLEHGGGEVGLEYLEQTKGAVIKKITLPMPSTSVEEVVMSIRENITRQTKVVMLSHVNTVTGMLMPFSEVSKITQPKGIVLIADGAQAPGLTKVDVKALQVDAYAASGHKWLMGPKETGFLFVSKRFQNQFHPVFSSSGFAAYSKSSGTRNVATIIALGVAMDWHNSIGTAKIHQRCLEIRNYCLRELQKLNDLKIISPSAESLSTGIISFSLTSKSNEAVFNALKEKDIIVKLLTQHNAIRISCHMFVLKSDIDTFISSLKLLL